MKHRFFRIFSFALALLLVLPLLASCKKENVYTLGPVSIKEDEYAYLLSIYKAKLLASLSLSEDDMDTEVSSGITVGSYLASTYQSTFEYDVKMLLYCQVLFDDYELSLSDTVKSNIDDLVSLLDTASTSLYGKKFNSVYKEYGFKKDTVKNVLLMQAKRNAVLVHLYGSDWKNVSATALDSYLNEYYLHYQALVVNNVYRYDQATETYVLLSDAEKEYQNNVIEDLCVLFGIKKVTDYQYKVIDSSLSYEELYRQYSDDQTYQNGMISKILSAQQLAYANEYNPIRVVQFLLEGDVGKVLAVKSASGMPASLGITGVSTIQYGTVFLKRLPMEENAIAKSYNQDFFENENIYETVALKEFDTFLQSYQLTAYYTFEEASQKCDYDLATMKPCTVTYALLYGQE